MQGSCKQSEHWITKSKGKAYEITSARVSVSTVKNWVDQVHVEELKLCSTCADNT